MKKAALFAAFSVTGKGTHRLTPALNNLMSTWLYMNNNR
jgi:hypothetical protein